jgi:hypothetical protein
MRPAVKLLAILIFGALVISPTIAYLDLDPVPGDIAFSVGDLHIHLPVLYSLCASGVLTLFYFILRR